MKKSTKWINFLGGSNLLYTLIVLILLAILILLMIHLDFLFTPIAILISNILMPLITKITTRLSPMLLIKLRLTQQRNKSGLSL